MKRKILSFLTMLCMVTALMVTNVAEVSAYTGTKYGDYLYYQISNKKVTITDCISSAKEVEIPETINGYNVTSIGNEAFSFCTKLKSITIPNSITSIGEKAFYQCTNLTSATIGNNVATIGKSAFYGCDSLTSITIPDSVTTISNYTFYKCFSLETVIIPHSITTIGTYAFDGCIKLKNVYYNGTENNWSYKIKIYTNNTYFKNATRTYFAYINIYDKNDNKILDTTQNMGETVNTSNITIPNGYTLKLYTDKEMTQEYSLDIPISKNMTLYADFVKAVIGTKTTVSEDGKTFTVKPINIASGNTVILALYNGNSFVGMEEPQKYEGNDLTFKTNKTYTNAKIMVWDSLEGMQPQCEAEIVNTKID